MGVTFQKNNAVDITQTVFPNWDLGESQPLLTLMKA
jgi:hypothetical protein